MAGINIFIFVLQVVFGSQLGRPASENGPANWVSVRVVIGNKFRERRLPHIAHAQTLAQMDVAEWIYVNSFGVSQIFKRALGKVLG